MKKFIGLFLVLALFSGCAMVPNTPEVSPVLTLGATESASPDSSPFMTPGTENASPSTSPESTSTAILFDIESIKENDKMGDFTVKEVKRNGDKVEYVRAEGKLTLEGTFARGDKVEGFDHTLYLKDGETASNKDFAVFKFQRSANDALPIDEVLMNLDELTLVVKLKDGTYNSDYGRAKIDIMNINYTAKAEKLKYYSFDAALHSQEAAPEHEFARQ